MGNCTEPRYAGLYRQRLCSEKTTIAEEQITIDSQRQILKREDRIWQYDQHKAVMADMNYFVKQQFPIDFPKGKIVGYMEEEPYHVVEFTRDGNSYRAYYNYDAKLLGTITMANMQELPGDAAKELREEYPHYKVDKVILFHDYNLNKGRAWHPSFPIKKRFNYFVKMTGPEKSIVLRINQAGTVSYFRTLS